MGGEDSDCLGCWTCSWVPVCVWLPPGDGEIQLPCLPQLHSWCWMKCWNGAVLRQSPSCGLGVVAAQASEPGGGNGCQDSTPVSPVGVLLAEAFQMLQLPGLCAWLRTVMHFVGAERS